VVQLVLAFQRLIFVKNFTIQNYLKVLLVKHQIYGDYENLLY